MATKTSRNPPVLLKPAEVAEQLRCHYLTVLDYRARGEFPNAVNRGGKNQGTRWLIPQSDVDHFLESRRLDSVG